MATKKTHSVFLEEIQNLPGISLYPSDQTYINTITKMTFSCDKGHIFETTPKNLLTRIKGCPECKKNARSRHNVTSKWDFLEKLEQRNQLHDPVYLIGQYYGTSKQTSWECENGHQWKAAPKTILRGHGCKVCKNKQKQTYSLELVNLLLKDRNIEAVSNKDKDLHVRCRVCDHRWNPNIGDLLSGKSNCVKCSSSYSKKAIAWLEHIAKEEGIVIRHALNGGEHRIADLNIRVDGFCEETNTVYEFHGDLWHGNPEKFNPNDVNPVNYKTYGELHSNTLKREKAIRHKGFNLVTIWEKEFDKLDIPVVQPTISVPQVKTGSDTFHKFIISLGFVIDADYTYVCDKTVVRYWTLSENSRLSCHQVNQFYHHKRVIHVVEDEWEHCNAIVKSKLIHLSKKSKLPLIHGRKTAIRELTFDQKSNFLKRNHIQGDCTSSIAIGAFFEDQLVAVMTFVRPRAPLGGKSSNCDCWELARFATDIEYRIPGVASKLLKFFERTYQPSEIYSYADNRWSDGNLYKQLGFVETAFTNSNYWYIVGDKRVHRWTFNKANLEQLGCDVRNKTEREITKELMIKRFYDCGTRKFTRANTKKNT